MDSFLSAIPPPPFSSGIPSPDDNLDHAAEGSRVVTGTSDLNTDVQTVYKGSPTSPLNREKGEGDGGFSIPFPGRSPKKKRGGPFSPAASPAPPPRPAPIQTTNLEVEEQLGPRARELAKGGHSPPRSREPSPKHSSIFAPKKPFDSFTQQPVILERGGLRDQLQRDQLQRDQRERSAAWRDERSRLEQKILQLTDEVELKKTETATQRIRAEKVEKTLRDVESKLRNFKKETKQKDELVVKYQAEAQTHR